MPGTALACKAIDPRTPISCRNGTRRVGKHKMAHPLGLVSGPMFSTIIQKGVGGHTTENGGLGEYLVDVDTFSVRDRRVPRRFLFAFALCPLPVFWNRHQRGTYVVLRVATHGGRDPGALLFIYFSHPMYYLRTSLFSFSLS